MGTTDIDIIRYRDGKAQALRDTVVTEDWLDLYVNGTKLLETPISGRELEELIYGFLYVEGYLLPGERLEFTRDHDAWYTHVDREVKPVTMKELVDCAASKIEFGEEIEALPAGPKISAETIIALAADFQNLPSLYHSTGGVHMAAFAAAQPDDGDAASRNGEADSPTGTDGVRRSGRILHSADDISRRNAADKVIGKVFLAGAEPAETIGIDRSSSAGSQTGAGRTDKVRIKANWQRTWAEGLLLISGRISSDIVLRMLKTGIPVVVSKSAPTEKAVRIAEAYGVTLCGFARGRRVNIYTHSERVDLGA